MKKMTSNFFVLLLLVTLGIFACSSETKNNKVLENNSGTALSGAGIGNLPPQGQSSSFFDNKVAYDFYLPAMKELFQKNYTTSFKQLSPEDIKNNSYFVTPFGYAISLSNSGQSSSVEPRGAVSTEGSSDKKDSNRLGFYGLSGCNPSTDFVCVDQPLEGQGVDDPPATVAISGSIDVCRSATLPPLPHLNVVIVHVKSSTVVYRQSFCDAAADPGCDARPKTVDLKATGMCTGATPSRVGNFSIPAAALNDKKTGPGQYKIIFDASDKLGTSPKQVNVFLEGDPQIAWRDKDPFVSPSENPGNIYSGTPQLKTAVKDTDNVSMAYVTAYVKFLTEATVGVSIQFANYEDDPATHPALKPRYVSSGDAFSTYMGAPLKSATLKLFKGKNYFKVTAYRMNKPVPPPSSTNTLTFSLNNEEPTVDVKILEVRDDKKDIPIYPACPIGQDGKPNCPPDPKPSGSYKVPTKSVHFCFINPPSIPSKTAPVDGQGCITNWRDDPSDRQVTVNGRLLESGCITPDGSGIFKFDMVPPEVAGAGACIYPGTLQTGVNFFKIDGGYGGWDTSSSDAIQAGQSMQGSLIYSFGYGKVNPLFVNKGGVVTNSLNSQADSFITGIDGAVSLQIQDKIIKNDLKQMALNYLTKQENIENLFKNYNGSASLNFLPGFQFGAAVLNQWGVDSARNVFTVDATIPGMVGDAENVTGPRRCEDGLHSDVIPIRFEVKSLNVRVSVKFEKDGATGLLKLVETEGSTLIKPNGKLARGRYVWIDSHRYPTDLQNTCATVIERKDVDGAIVQGQIDSALDGTVKSLPNKFNNDRWTKDIFLLTGYDSEDPFRFSKTFNFLGSEKSVDVAYDLLRAGSVSFRDEGIQIWSVPVRVNPGQKSLNNLLSDPNFVSIINSVPSIGSFSSPLLVVPPPPRRLVNDDHNIQASLSEDLLNQALFALSEGGLLDLQIDPNFFVKNSIPFIYQVTPQVSDLLKGASYLDINQDGVRDDQDKYHPLQLRTYTDKVLPPHIHFLSPLETKQLVSQVKAYKKDVDLNPNLRYFRLTLSNLSLGIYPVAPVPNALKTFCNSGDNVIPDPDIDPMTQNFRTRGQGAAYLVLTPPKVPLPNSRPVCAQTASIFYQLPDGVTSCPKDPFGNDMTAVQVQTANGAVTSETPLVKFRTDLVLYGVIQGTFEEALTSDMYDNAGNKKTDQPMKTKFIRIRILNSSSFGDSSSFKNLAVLENHSSESSTNLISQLQLILDNALNPQSNQDCGAMNEFRIPLNSLRFPQAGLPADDPTVKLLGSLGVDYLDFTGSKKEEWPAIDVDFSSINLLLHLGVHWSP